MQVDPRQAWKSREGKGFRGKRRCEDIAGGGQKMETDEKDIPILCIEPFTLPFLRVVVELTFQRSGC